MKNKNEESENYEEMSMQNFNPCMYCPMMMNCSMMYENINMQRNQMMPSYSEESFEEQEQYRPGPSHGPGPGPGPWHNYNNLINQPVGVSLTNGQGVSGILCRVTNREIYLLVYLYQSQFATKHFPLGRKSVV